MNLKEIESKLEELIKVEKKYWVDFYLLIKEVEENKLWQNNYNSFTQWVKDFSVRNKCHESSIWQKKRAGEVYSKYEAIQKEKGNEVKKLEETKVSAESLVILEKIIKCDPGQTEQLVEKVLNNDISRKDLREIYRAVRPDPEVKKEIKDINKEKIESIKITTADILTVLFKFENWLKKKERKYFKTAFEQNKVEMFTEFPVWTGTTRYSRRLDLLCIENLTTEQTWEVNLHGLEIKISKEDLLQDHKYSEYVDFVNYFWLVVPEELKTIALENKFDGCGLIAIKQEQEQLVAKIVEKPDKLEAVRREDTLVSVALKLMR